ncbi:MAG: hypothetical protein OXU78_10915, partial [Deltaproteobacteria bacterium]|nr:hypothetical protein [Deltaproteobacteria bacterium]
MAADVYNFAGILYMSRLICTFLYICAPTCILLLDFYTCHPRILYPFGLYSAVKLARDGMGWPPTSISSAALIQISPARLDKALPERLRAARQ